MSLPLRVLLHATESRIFLRFGTAEPGGPLAYRFESNEPLPAALKRVATEQVNGMIRALRDRSDVDLAVHETRKALKRVRAVLRLVRDEIGEERYRQENKSYRDVGRALSGFRDGRVAATAAERLAASDRDDATLRRGAERLEIARSEPPGDFTEALAGQLTIDRRRIAGWPIVRDEFAMIGPGLERAYGRGRRAHRGCEREPAERALHEWRKRVKDLGYAIQLLAPARPETLNRLADDLRELWTLLGDDHDLAVLMEVSRADPRLTGEELRAVEKAVVSWRTDHRTGIWPLAARICEEPPDLFVRRIEGYWKAWRADPGISPPAVRTAENAALPADQTVGEMRDLGAAELEDGR